MLRTNASVIGATAVVDAKRWPLMHPQVAHHRPGRLQVRHVDIEVHPVDRLELQRHVITQHLRHAIVLCSSRTPVVHGSSDPPSFNSSHDQGMSLPARPESTSIKRRSPISSQNRRLYYSAVSRRSYSASFCLETPDFV